MDIVFYGYNYHIGDIFFFKSFLNKFCKINNNIYLLLQSKEYKCNNYFLFLDIPNLTLLNDNNIYIMYVYDNLKIINNKIYINIWCGVCDKFGETNVKNIECNLKNINNYYNNIINYINNIYNLNYNLIPIDYIELPKIPYTNIDNFLEFKENKKIIFYYNMYPKSGQLFPIDNHDIIIDKLSNIYKDYYIICSNKTNINKSNVINTEDKFNNFFTYDGENIAKYIYYALNSDIIIIYDIGACFYILNEKILNYKGKIIHINCNNYYYNSIKSVLNIENYINLTVNNSGEIIKKILNII